MAEWDDSCLPAPKITELDSKWLHWHQSIVGLNGTTIQARILHSFPLNYSESYKSLLVDLTLRQKCTEDPFWKLTIFFESLHRGNSKNRAHYHYFLLDRCAIRIFFKGANGKRITRWVHMNSKALLMTTEMQESVNLATFEDPYFISDDALDDLRTEASPTSTAELEVEIHGRLKICCFNSPHSFPGVPNNCEFTEGFGKWVGQDLSLAKRPKLSSNSFNNFVTVGPEDADIKFVMTYDSTKILPAHSFLLAAQSPVLRKMLSMEMVEKSKGVITVSDTPYTSVELFLNLLYGRETAEDLMKLPAGDALNILSLANKYQVDYLVRISCMAILTFENEDLNVEEIQQMYHAGSLFDIPDLEHRGFQWLKWRRDTAQGYKEVTDLLEGLDERFVKKFCSFLLSPIVFQGGEWEIHYEMYVPRVHMNCKELVMTSEIPESIILATFEDPCFISEDTLNELRSDSDAVGLPTGFGELEVHGRLKICCLCIGCNNCKITEGLENWFDQDLSLSIRPKFSSNSFNNLTIDSVDADTKFVMGYDSTKILTAHSFVLA
ncbi:unnamed protein product, partial [Allacma fusca]